MTNPIWSLDDLGPDPAPEMMGNSIAAFSARLLDFDRGHFERLQGMFGLRSLMVPEAIPAIEQVLFEDPSAIMRHEAAYVLGQLQLREGIEPLKRSMESEQHIMVRHEAVEALGVIGSEELIPYLEHILANDPDLEVRESAAIALDNIRYRHDPDRL